MTDTNPWSWYSDPAVLAAERERIFRAAWHYVGHEGRLPEPASYFACVTGGLPVVVIRDREGELRAFLNVCRHRGSEIVSGEGRRETLQCPYHAWTYGLDGELRSAPRADREAELRRRPGSGCCRSGSSRGGRSCSFAPIRTRRRSPRRSAAARAAVRPGRRSSSGSASTTRSRRTGRSRSRTTSSATTARSRTPASASSSTSIRTRTCSTATAAVWSQYGQGAAGEGECAFHLVWPGAEDQRLPGPANLSIGPVWPESPERTVGFLDYFFGADVADADARELIEFDDQVGREDTALVESVQRGVAAGLIEQGRLPAGQRAPDRRVPAPRWPRRSPRAPPSSGRVATLRRQATKPDG